MKKALVLAGALALGCGGVTEVGNDGGFSLAVEPPSITLAPGDSVDVTITITREPGFEGAVDLGVLDLPQGVEATGATAAAGETTAVLTLTTPDDSAQHGRFALEIEGLAGDLRETASVDALVRGAPGQLDRSFAGTGFVTFSPFSVASVGRDALVDPAGNVLVTGATVDGRALVARILADGSPDDSFGVNGVASIASGNTAGGLVLRISGQRILAAGWGGDLSGADSANFQIYGFTSDGNIDQTFGAAGIASIDPTADTTGFAELHGFAIGSDGALYAVGIDFGSNDSHLVRFDPDGSNGAVILSSGVGVRMHALAIQDDDRSVLAGSGGAAGAPSNYVVIRTLPTGELETETGADFAAAADVAAGVVILEDGSYLIGGVSGGFVSFARLDSSFGFVPDFGTAGQVTTNVAFNEPPPNFMKVDSAGHIVVAGGSGAQLAVARFTAAGEPDEGFGEAGLTFVDPGLAFADGRSGFYGVALDELDRIVVVGEAGASGEQQIVVARIWN